MTSESPQSDTMTSSDPTVENFTEETVLEEERSEETALKENLGEDGDEEGTGNSRENSRENSGENNWEPADLPGTVLAVDDVAVGKPTADKLADKLMNKTTTSAASVIASTREAELLTLIHDLNECNDVLLARVSHLETTLENSQENFNRALQQERDSAKAAQGQIMERANAQQASAQQMSQHAQQQVASLVDQLETAQQDFQRQQLVNETLLSELENAKERVNQLEHECALNAQQQAEEAQSRTKSESTIRDLRSRLQRQQRYTLQFKAALEKSLTVNTRSAPASVHPSARISGGAQTGQHTIHAAVQPISSFSSSPLASQSVSVSASGNRASNPAAGGVTMPKSQRIVPWAAQSTAPFEGIDPHLESLIRGAGQLQPVETAEQDPIAHMPEGADALDDVLRSDTEAESQLWQDLERVIENNETNDASNDNDLLAEDPSAERTVNQDSLDIATDQRLEAFLEEKQSAETSKDLSEDSSQGVENQPMPEQRAQAQSEKSAVPTLNDSPKFNWQPNVSQPEAEKSESEKSEVEKSEAEKSEKAPVAANSSDSSNSETSHPTPVLEAQTASGQEPASSADSDQARSNIPSIVIDPYTVPEGQTPEAEVGFTEPSPWGGSVGSSGKAQEKAADRDLETQALPLVDGERSSVSPVVNPLRSQKKKNSMAAVQLPTFEKAKVSSFRR